MTVRAAFLAAHRWASVVLAAFWLIQAVTGVLIVFHWELDDATISAPHQPTDIAAIDRRITALEPAGSGWNVGSVWVSAGAADRYDVFMDNARTGEAKVVRIDGAGNVLRTRFDGERFTNGGLVDTLVTLHQTLLAGDRGSWIVGISGILLVTNILMGIGLAWPRRRMWRRALQPPRGGPLVGRLYGWHRMLGLWIGVLAALTVSAGTMLVFEGGVEKLVAATPVEAPAEPLRAATPLRFAQLSQIALARYPGSKLSGISFPAAGDAAWQFRLLLPNDIRRAYSTTSLFLSGNDGRVLADFDARTAAPGRRFADILFPIHTGEIGGLAGRLGIVVVGLWLITMIVLGLSLWLKRRAMRRKSAQAGAYAEAAIS